MRGGMRAARRRIGGRSLVTMADDEADAAGSVAGGMEDVRRIASPANGGAFLDEILDGSALRSGNSEPLRLDVEMAIKLDIAFVDEDGRAGGAVKTGEAADMVNVGVGADDGADFQIVAEQNFEDALDFVSGVHDDGFAGRRIAQDGAIALEQADGDDFVYKAFWHRIQV